MQRLSLGISATALGCMALGLAITLVGKPTQSLLEYATLDMPALLHPRQEPLGLVVMSLGILLLATLPIVRVVLALGLYTNRGDRRDALVALVVLVELSLSMLLGRP